MKLFKIIIISASLIGCANDTDDKNSTLKADETEIIKKTPSIDAEVESTILSTLRFYISKKNGEKEIKDAIKPLIDTTSERKRYLIGEFKFRNIIPMYHNDSLYKVRIQGGAFSVNEIAKIAPKEIKRLNDVLTIKYGEPEIRNQIPSYFDQSFDYTIEEWNYGNKVIKTQVSPNEFGYWEVDLVIFRKDIYERLEKEKKAKSQNVAKKGAENI